MKNSILKTFIGSEFPELKAKEVSRSEELDLYRYLSRAAGFRSYTMVVMNEGLSILNSNIVSYLVLMSVNFTSRSGRLPQHEQNLTEYNLIGIAPLQKNYGKALIRPETLADKISEWFQPIELDFVHDNEFSRKYYVLASDEDKFRKNVSFHFLATIRSFNELEIELNENILIARQKTIFTPESGRIITRFISEINDGIN